MIGPSPVTVINGDARTAMLSIADQSVDCVVTSPPYYEQRDYEMETQIGMEESPEAYVAELVAVFAQVRRVLVETGTVWLNIGDSYYSGNGQPTASDPRSSSRNWIRERKRFLDTPGKGYPKKSLLGIPWRVALALQADGWTLRAEIIWARETALAEASVTDRPHRQHETLFLFSKARRYYFDRSALPEETVWHIPHQRGLRGHSAPFPEELPRRCIAAGCPPGGRVLDPFGGAGTTGLVALETGRTATLIELNPAYCALAQSRITDRHGLFAA